jgi:lipoyl(octanoyl) transferase
MCYIVVDTSGASFERMSTLKRKTVSITPERAAADLEWRHDDAPVPYPAAVAFMENRVKEIAEGGPELVWLLEHPPIYTAGTSAREGDLIDARFPVFRSGRGGQFTYHGPGQRVGYVMLDLKRRKTDVGSFVRALEDWLIATLARFGIRGERSEGRVGIWVGATGSEKKIAQIGVRVRHWVTYHGVSLNVAPDLTHFDGIVPCGVRDRGVTSLAALGADATMTDVDAALTESFAEIF